MKSSFSKKQVCLSSACALAFALVSGIASAQVMPGSLAADHSLLNDGSGRVVMSQFGLCWHTGQGPRPESTAQCDPNYRAPVAQYVAPAAAPVPAAAPAPRPAPMVVAAAAPVYEKVTFNANVLFDFDKSALTPAGRSALDEFLGKTRNLIDPGSVLAVGYADRIGGTDYNQKLSEERVATVKEYLVSRGLEAKQVSTSARGEMQPTTRGECDGASSNRNIACLQPDRHVFIELTGSRLKQ